MRIVSIIQSLGFMPGDLVWAPREEVIDNMYVAVANGDISAETVELVNNLFYDEEKNPNQMLIPLPNENGEILASVMINYFNQIEKESLAS